MVSARVSKRRPVPRPELVTALRNGLISIGWDHRFRYQLSDPEVWKAGALTALPTNVTTCENTERGRK